MGKIFARDRGTRNVRRSRGHSEKETRVRPARFRRSGGEKGGLEIVIDTSRGKAGRLKKTS